MPTRDHRGDAPRRRFARLAAVTATLSLAASVGAQPAQTSGSDLPRRRPGSWRISTLSPEIGLQAHEVCIAAGDGLVGPVEENCAKPVVESANDQWIVTISCGRAGGREVTSLLFTGDFTSWYRAQAKTTFTRADGTAAPGSGFTIDAKFLGPDCPKER
ncbi:DUF3617 family protein [Methylosinus sp. Sm6]|uniref:DUF3617 domain-containing protein n=1 Tax=Methylosinus sp. Sm6 TaxID=2866948 RepID=UPI001C990E4D|nr:DUF3617 family protein [Methylosinus sp. Sm6]MBY6241643.1 hypothetical protein [Methylosinus sp. Sm6]